MDVIEEKTGIPASTTSTALVEAMREMGIARVAIASPYPQWVNDRLVKFLSDRGIETVAVIGAGTDGRG